MHAKKNLIKFGLFLGDILLAGLGFLLTRWMVSGMTGVTLKDWSFPVIFLACMFFFFLMYDLYTAQIETVYTSTVSSALATLAACACAFAITFLFRIPGDRPPVAAVCHLLVTVALLVSWRTVAAKLLIDHGIKRKMLIIENMQNTSRLARKLKYASTDRDGSFYYMLDETNEKEVNAIIDNEIEKYDLIFISPYISSSTTTRIMDKAFLLQKTVSVLADMDGVSTLHGKIIQMDDTPLIEKKGLQISRLQQTIKRSFDIVFALILIILSSPVALVCAIAVKFDSPGPVIYKQARYTKGKKVFHVYKFRTMVQDAEKGGAQFATEDDPRITKSGKFLRATRLDELPQLYNILFGSMSVVGPRPERPVFADEFAKKVAHYDMRHCVKAGLTGYAQVYGKYNTRVSDKILMDMIYVLNYSVFLDLKLILLTIKTMFVKSATEGVDEERDALLSSTDKEGERRQKTIEEIGENTNEDIYHHSGI